MGSVKVLSSFYTGIPWEKGNNVTKVSPRINANLGKMGNATGLQIRNVGTVGTSRSDREIWSPPKNGRD